MLSGFEPYPRWVPLMHVTKVEKLYDSLNYEDEFNQGDRLFDSKPCSFKIKTEVSTVPSRLLYIIILNYYNSSVI